MFDWISQPGAWVGLITLTVLEVVLGIDNIVFISILSNKLHEGERDRARSLGLLVALVSRIALLLSISWVKSLTNPVFTLPLAALPKHVAEISWKDLILIVGGMFLIWKSVKEIHEKLEGEDGHETDLKAPTLLAVLTQILILDVVFSLDSVITAVGMADQIGVMILAVILAVVFMLRFSGSVARFVEDNPTIKMLALSFLVMIGANLIAEGMGQDFPKGYTYFAMGFAVGVEMLNLKMRKRVGR